MPDRRTFIAQALLSAGALALTNTMMAHTAKPLTVQDIIDLILQEGGLSPIPNTVDTIKAGQASQVVTGIVTTMFPTIAIIEETAKRKANFIIAHEPSFYNHLDKPEWVKDNSILKQKQQLLEKYQIAIWRFHDYCHSLKPDAVSYGVIKKAGWLPYYTAGQATLTIPSLSLQQLARHLKTALGIQQVRVIGNLQQSCARIALMPGAAGGQRQVTVAETEKPDVLIVGESPEWETVEYMRDAALLGEKKSLIVLGHSVSEEPGMEYFADWLQPKIAPLTVTHITSGNPFTWV